MFELLVPVELAASALADEMLARTGIGLKSLESDESNNENVNEKIKSIGEKNSSLKYSKYKNLVEFMIIPYRSTSEFS